MEDSASPPFDSVPGSTAFVISFSRSRMVGMSTPHPLLRPPLWFHSDVHVSSVLFTTSSHTTDDNTASTNWNTSPITGNIAGGRSPRPSSHAHEPRSRLATTWNRREKPSARLSTSSSGSSR